MTKTLGILRRKMVLGLLAGSALLIGGCGETAFGIAFYTQMRMDGTELNNCGIWPAPGCGGHYSPPPEIVVAARNGDVEKVRKMLPVASRAEIHQILDISLSSQVKNDLYYELVPAPKFTDDVFHLLVPEYVRFDTKVYQDQSVIDAALENKRCEIAQWLLDAGASPDQYALTRAVSSPLVHDYDKCNQLVAIFIPNRTQERLNSALFAAAYEGNREAAALLLAASADVNNVRPSNVDPVAPLDEAIRMRHYDVAQLLLDRGANPNGANKCNTPLYRIFSTVSLYSGTRPPRGEGGLKDALLLAQSLIEHGADPHARGCGSGETLMHLAARDGSAMRLLLAYGVGINARDFGGRTALHYIVNCDFHNTALLREIVALGGDINAQDNHGRTVLQGVSNCQGRYAKDMEIEVRNLIDNGSASNQFRR